MISSRLICELAPRYEREPIYSPEHDLARDLQMSDRHMRRLASGDAKLTPGMAMDLWRIALERSQELEDVIERLKVTATPNYSNK